MDLHHEFDSAAPGWEKVTVSNALGHRTGIANGYLDINTEDILVYSTDAFLTYTLSAPIVYASGENYRYSAAAF